MKHFLMAHDTPNWFSIMFFALCWMYRVSVELLEWMRRREYERVTGEEDP